ncbi:Transcriptional regulator medusa [Penicillium ucsense]|uniref:Transcriptional regulator medusa n=1 Tax=Penicillium ucsense TaxID=2839758 RepID=A0A8J8WH68_9EURO|nr:Transcriptional regulator medusa [Penicillium ucsense]KAF7729275.1 Transcriptional regulator medusa [Penicillium ucsense]
MSSFPKPAAGSILDYASTRSLQDAGSYSTYGQSPYVASSLVPSPMADQASQISDCVPYIPGQEFATSYEEAPSPMMGARPRQAPEVLTYSPQRGIEGARVVVQIQSPFDLHSSCYGALYLVFGTKRCECNPHFLGFQGANFQYCLSVDAPPFSATGSRSTAVPLQIVLEAQNDSQPTTLQVGVFTYDRVSRPSPDAESRKRKFSNNSDNLQANSSSFKRFAGPQSVLNAERNDNYTYRDGRSASYSPYMQTLPGMTAFGHQFPAAASPRSGPVQFMAGAAASQPGFRAPSPLTSTWGPSFIPAPHDLRGQSLGIGHPTPQHRGPSPARTPSTGNPTLIRTSTLQQASGLGNSASFNPYAMYPTKAVLKLNGDLNSMAVGWSTEERQSQRRLVQFTRSQNGSTINADFKPVTPEERAPNSICISCIHWEGKDECFVTSVDTIYLLESLVAVRFTVEEKNRIRRNLEGFRPLTVSKAKADSEEFFKVIMGFPAPKPRNIEKDVKVFPWSILSEALRKIIGKYSASYSSTAGVLPASMSHFAAHGNGSDSGTEPHTVPSPPSLSDAGNASTYAHHAISAPVYASQSDQVCAPMSGPVEYRSVMPPISQPYTSIGTYSYPPISHPAHGHSLMAPARTTWELHGMGASAPTTSATYTYLDPGYPVHDAPQGR